MLDARFRSFVESEWGHFFRNLWIQFGNILWMNHPDAIENGRNKMLQLRLAEDIGFLVPDTIYSNSVTEIMAFQRRHGCCIYKPHDGRSFSGNKKRAVFTSVIRQPFTPEMADELSICPGIFQPYIPKLFEVRITVVGDEVFATKIDSRANKQAETDWRKEDFRKLRHEKYQLDPSDEKMCLRLVNKLDLNFAAIDAIVTPENQLIFLEVNCNGQWAWIEAMTKQPISTSIAQNLIAGKKQ
jgi:glutathione synthase/RimK-type ligase-like ATP-grasp enzyme